MTPFWAVVKRELWTVIRDRTIVISILIQFFIASFSSGLFLGMLQLYDVDTILRYSGGAIKIGVVNPSENQLSVFIADHGMTVVPFATLNQAEAGFYNGEAIAIIDAPQETDGITVVRIFLPESNTISSIVRMVIQEPLKEYENYLRIQKGVGIRYTDLQGEPSISFEFIYSVLLPMLMFFPAFVAGSMAVDSIAEEVENQTLDTLRAGPVSVNSIFGAKIMAALVLALIQCAAWLGLLRLNQIQIQNGALVLVVALLIAALNAVGSALIAVALRDRERAQFVYSIGLLGTVAVSTLLNLSPIGLVTRLATGDAFTSLTEVLIYNALVLILLFVFFRATRRLTTV